MADSTKNKPTPVAAKRSTTSPEYAAMKKANEVLTRRMTQMIIAEHLVRSMCEHEMDLHGPGANLARRVRRELIKAAE